MFVAAMNGGYDPIVHDGGSTLSGSCSSVVRLSPAPNGVLMGRKQIVAFYDYQAKRPCARTPPQTSIRAA